MKKVISAIAASVLAVSAFPISSASAIETAPANELSVSTEVLETSITVGDTVIPAGATAVTVSIDNNTGFNNNFTKLLIGNAYDVIVSESYTPVISVGDSMENFCTAAFENNNTVAFSAASSELNYSNGEIFTIFLETNHTGSDESIAISNEEAGNILRKNVNSTRAFRYATRGDVNDDGYINSADSSDVLEAISQYVQLNPADPNADYFTVFACSLSLSTFFPDAPCAEIVDTDKDNFVSTDDANCILQYYTWLSVGGDPDSCPYANNYCGEPVKYYY